jgi:hypothetical protein
MEPSVFIRKTGKVDTQHPMMIRITIARKSILA